MSRGTTLVLLAALVIASVPALAVTAPTAAVGDKWTYAVPKSGGGNDTSITTVTASGEDIIYETNTWTNVTGTPGPLGPVGGSTSVMKTVTTVRASDRAVKTVVVETPQGASGVSQQQTTTTTYDPPCVLLKWPVTLNATWDVACTYTVRTNVQLPSATPPPPSELKSKFRVTDREDVTVGGTTYTAYRIANETTVQYFVPSVCSNVREGRLAGSTETVLRDLVSFSCGTPGIDDYVAPPPSEEDDPTPPPTDDTPPADDGNVTDDPDTDEPVDTSQPPADEEDDGFLGLPGPAPVAVLALVGLAALAWRRRVA